MDGGVFGWVGVTGGGIDGLWRVTGDVQLTLMRYTMSEREGEKISISALTISSLSCWRLFLRSQFQSTANARSVRA